MRVRLDGGEEAELTWDDDGFLIGHGLFEFKREGPAGAISQISDGTTEVDSAYDGAGRVQSRTVAVEGEEIYVLQLAYDNAGRITQRVETVLGVASTHEYEYDPDGWLTEVKRDGAVVESYSYDDNGNRTGTLTASATYDQQDRLTAHGGVTYRFDDDGFLALRGSDVFQYSARGELLEATVAGNRVTYSYDGFWRVVGRSDGAGTYQYLYGDLRDMFRVTAIRDPAGVLTECYYDDAGHLFAFRRTDTWYYVAADQVGTPRVVTDATGNVVKLVEYDSFGVELSDSAADFDLPIGFAGGLSDPVTGVVRFGFRDYAPIAGRWTARDPILFTGPQMNLYAYSGNNPVNSRDPSGLWCVGGGAGAGPWVGAQLCCTWDGCSLCVEVGVGIGAGVSGSFTGGQARSGTSFGAEVSAGIGPLGVSVSGTLSECGAKIEADISAFGVSASKGKIGKSKGTKAGGVSAEAKITVTHCVAL